MDSEKLQKLANLAIVRQHAAGVTASTNFQKAYINKVNNCLSALDAEFVKELTDLVGDVSKQDNATISQRLAEEKAKLNKPVQKEVVNTSALDETVLVDLEVSNKSETRPSIKTSKKANKNEASK